MENKAGVYQWYNKKDGTIYIGSSENIYVRKNRHLRELKFNIHFNEHFQNAVNRDGIENFKWSILELVPQLQNESKKDFGKRLTTIHEQYYLDTLLFASENDNRFYELGYNKCRRADTVLGIKRKPFTKEHRAGISKSKKGKKRSREVVNRIASKNRNKKRSQEVKNKISKSKLEKEFKHTKASKKLMSKKKKGVPLGKGTGKGKKQPRDICVWCNEEHSLQILAQYHNTFCKKNPNITQEQLNKRNYRYKIRKINYKNRK